MAFCYRCKQLIIFIDGLIGRNGKLIPCDLTGEPHRCLYEWAWE